MVFHDSVIVSERVSSIVPILVTGASGEEIL